MITHLEVNTVNQFSQYQLVMSNFPFQHGRFSLQWLHSQASWAGCVKSQLGWAAIGSLQLKSILFWLPESKYVNHRYLGSYLQYVSILFTNICRSSKNSFARKFLRFISVSILVPGALNAWDIALTWFDQFLSLRAVAAQPCRRWKIFHNIP